MSTDTPGPGEDTARHVRLGVDDTEGHAHYDIGDDDTEGHYRAGRSDDDDAEGHMRA